MGQRASRARQEWANERPDLDADIMALAGRLLEAAHRLERDWLAPLASRFGLQIGEFDVLATLRRAGQPYALTPTALHEALLLSSGAMTSRLDHLQRKGWIERLPDPHDRRSVRVQLTPAGIDLLDTLLPLHVENEQRAFGGIDAREQRQLDALLTRLLEGLNAPRPTTE
ncbi:MarR family transcriptional regulator [Achromobacter sp. GG226]|uniref:MarR family winged helix-turn-helix transcriptional regulator n=1 Tax=Verticiella alkaliphila TaxID=2779529 RepID=UPI001C0E3484|nr:MarR family transcriptional regulator [Verticiella sp. GG226]MBU4612764.1 MarR family transcriptional regulator [Verticiella sp. GG226]